MPKAKIVTPRDQFAKLTPYQKLRAVEALRKIESGEIKVPLACGWCESTAIAKVLEPDEHGLMVQMFHCQACARHTKIETAHALRKQKIRKIILEGVDLPPRPGAAAA